MELQELRTKIEKISPLYPEIREIFNVVLDEMKKTNPTLKENADPVFLQELIDINGIGKETAQDIVTVYPIKARLVNDIKAEAHLPFHKNIISILRTKYG